MSATFVTFGTVVLYELPPSVLYLMVASVGADTLVIAQLCSLPSYVQLFAPQPAALFAQLTAFAPIVQV